MKHTPIHSGILALLAVAPVAVAQQGNDPAPQATRASLEEIVVTAQRREESLQDTPISIQAFGSEQLETKGITDIVSLHSHVPNLQIAPHPNSSTTIRTFIRGVGNNDDQITQDPAVAVYLDGAYIARIQGLAMEVAEIERIEVLRGPQGTLYGRNATGGAINFVSRPPDLHDFGFRQTIGMGNRNLRRSHTRVNVPIIQDALALQFSYLSSSKDGFIDNRGTGAARFGDRERNAFRLDTLWQAADTVQLRYHYDRSDISDTPHFIDAVQIGASPSIPDGGSPLEPDVRRDDIRADGHGLTVTWALADGLEFKSMTHYRELEVVTDRNYLTDVVRPGVPLTGSTKQTEQDQFSQELQLSGEAFDSRLQYVGGLYYFDESASDTSLSGSDRNGVRFVTANNEAYAAFGQATYTPAMFDHRLHATLGARWSRDKRSASYQDGTLDGGLGTAVPGSNTYTNFSPTVVLAYDVTDVMNVYGKVARGYKSGGFNLRASSVERFSEGFGEESLTTYEVGFKSQLWDNRLRFNSALFHSDYKDIQINTQSDPNDPSVTDVLNAGKAVYRGIEMELTALLTDRLRLNLNYGYLDPEYKEIIGSDGIDRRDSFTPINAPRHNYTVDLNYRVPTAAGMFTADLGYTWQDNMQTSSSDPDFVIKRYGLLNTRLTLSEIPLVTQGELRVSLWGRNLTDETYYINLFRVSVPAALYGEPRSFGIDLSYLF